MPIWTTCCSMRFHFHLREVNSRKSKLVDCLLPDIILPISVDAQAIFIDGSFIAQSHKPRGVLNISEYIERTFLPLIKRNILKYERLDLLFDRYFPETIKGATRDHRGNDSGRYHIVLETHIPRQWKDFMRNSDNKSDLFSLIALTLKQKLIVPEENDLIVLLKK